MLQRSITTQWSFDEGIFKGRKIENPSPPFKPSNRAFLCNGKKSGVLGITTEKETELKYGHTANLTEHETCVSVFREAL